MIFKYKKTRAKMKYVALSILLLLTVSTYSQDNKKGKGDFDCEMKHKSQPWFSNMKDGANYFEIKNKFDLYFGNKQWEKSKPRALGESWLKSKIFYLDSKGKVQPEPKISRSNKYNSPLNSFNDVTTSVIGDWKLINRSSK